MTFDELKFEEVVVLFMVDYLFVKCFFERPLKKGRFSFAYYVYKEESPGVMAKTIYKSTYIQTDYFRIVVDEPGSYKVKVFIRDNKTNEVFRKLSESIIKV